MKESFDFPLGYNIYIDDLRSVPIERCKLILQYTLSSCDSILIYGITMKLNRKKRETNTIHDEMDDFMNCFTQAKFSTRLSKSMFSSLKYCYMDCQLKEEFSNKMENLLQHGLLPFQTKFILLYHGLVVAEYLAAEELYLWTSNMDENDRVKVEELVRISMDEYESCAQQQQ